MRMKKTTAELYTPYLLKFMAWKHGREEYEKGAVFTLAQLFEITPRDIVRYMCLQAYQTEDPGPEDKPIHARSGGLEVVKKAISSFMPNRNVKWNVKSQTGNPTMSVAVNDLIKKIKKAEVRKQGKKSNAKGDLKRPEFRKTHRLLEKHPTGGLPCHLRTPCMLNLQFHIIGRADDISNVETMDISHHDKFPAFALQMAVLWSKNVLDERDCPDKILLGMMDTDFCVLIALGCYLGTVLSTKADGHRFLFSNIDDDNDDYVGVSMDWKPTNCRSNLVTTNPDPQNMHDITRGKLVMVIPGSKQNSTHNFITVSK
jgi:hypothetical protein